MITYFTFTTNLVLGADLSTAWVTEAIDLGGFMVLDTACQIHVVVSIG